MENQEEIAINPHEVDVYVGSRMRALRMQHGMSQEKMAEHFKLTFQQVQKYERGVNRISSGRLYQLGQIFSVPITYFFDGFRPGEPFVIKEPKRRDMELMRAFGRIEDGPMKRQIFNLVKIASQDAENNTLKIAS